MEEVRRRRRSRPIRLRRALDLAWLLLLCGYALAGLRLVPFHPDETEHLRLSWHVVQSLREGRFDRLTRVLDPEWGGYLPRRAYLLQTVAPLHTYVMGAALHAAGMDARDLPGRWAWAFEYEINVQRGRRPDARWLGVARLASCLFLAATVWAVFALARALGGRPAAWLASGLFATSPFVLLHGRRAMLEGPLLFTGTLCLLLAAAASRRAGRGEPAPALRWLGLGVAAGACAATKHSGVALGAAALLWLFAAELLAAADPARALRRVAPRALLAAAAAVGIFLALNPALWRDPLSGLAQMARARTQTVETQVDFFGAPVSTSARLRGLVTTAFLDPPEPGHDRAETLRYTSSVWDGLALPPPLGLLLTLLAGLGLASAFWPALRSRGEAPFHAGLLVWSLAVFALALVNPLPWQRYWIPTAPLACVLAGTGLAGLLQGARRSAHPRRPSGSPNAAA